MDGGTVLMISILMALVMSFFIVHSAHEQD